VIIGDRLRDMREQKKLSQGDIEKRTGLLRCYISRVENGHTVPAIETLEKLARAMEIPLYQGYRDNPQRKKRKRIDRQKATYSCHLPLGGHVLRILSIDKFYKSRSVLVI
jgi:transcriptional regulator with XRE-family HTH domain